MIGATRKMKNTDNKLTVDVVDGEIVIRMGIDRLAHSAVTMQTFLDDEENPLLTVTDAGLFASDVCRALLDEEEDGTTLVDIMFDDAIKAAVEDGAEGCDLDMKPKKKRRRNA